MTSISVRHMLSDYEKWKAAFELLSSGLNGIKVIGYSTEMDKSNPGILITQIRLGNQEERGSMKSLEPIIKIFDEAGLQRRYEIEA